MIDKDKIRKRQREWLANRRAQFFTDKVCVECSGIENLELDHIDPSTKVNHRIWSWSKERQETEIAKCQILCHECHLKKTQEQSSVEWFQHGTKTMYKTHKCRCDLCRGWNAASKRKERLQSKLRV